MQFASGVVPNVHCEAAPCAIDKKLSSEKNTPHNIRRITFRRYALLHLTSHSI